MDLGSVNEKLHAHMYETLDAWVSDVNLVWNNAIKFNPAGNDVHESAKALSAMFDKRIKQFPKPPGSAATTSSVAAAFGDLAGGTDADKRNKMHMLKMMEQLQKQVSDLQKTATSKSSSGGAGGGQKKKTQGNPAAKKLTFEEKRALSLDINKLDEGKLGKVRPFMCAWTFSGAWDKLCLHSWELGVEGFMMLRVREAAKYCE